MRLTRFRSKPSDRGSKEKRFACAQPRLVSATGRASFYLFALVTAPRRHDRDLADGKFFRHLIDCSRY